jgi:hypothetical protein
LTHYPVFTLSAASALGCVLAIAALLAGYVLVAVLIFAATTLVLCLLIATWIDRSAK